MFDFFDSVRNYAYENNFHGVVLGLSENSRYCDQVAINSVSVTKSNLYTVSWDKSQIPKINSEKDNIQVEVAFL
jgi:hypothetical protein